MKICRKICILLLCAALVFAAVPVSAGAAAISFPDVPEGAWYGQYLNKIIWAQQQVGLMNIISGYPDGTFKPDDPVKRCEWLKMLFEAAESSGSQTAIVTPAEIQSGDHWAKRYYLKAKKDNILFPDINSMLTDNDKDGGSGQNLSKQIEPMFTESYADLNEPITRYEMAVILNNVCTNLAMQKTVIVEEPETHITDYAEIPEKYLPAVEQMYGKGLLTGYEDGHFGGDDTLTRAQAVTVLYRYLFVDTIRGEGLQTWASYPKVEVKAGAGLLDPSLSFANWLRNGHVDSWGHIDSAAKIKLFGTAYKDHFSSSYEAAPYMETVSVPVWVLNKDGSKTASTCAITVNKAVAEEVKSIFQMIFDDPEQFPIYGGWSAGGARYTDTMRHSWGCAIDINAYYNCECNTKSGYLKVTCGYGWWPINHADWGFAGSLSNQSPYSIGKTEGEYGYSVVKAFATYGWGWGGNGWSNGKSFDYMHFSVLPSGG